MLFGGTYKKERYRERKRIWGFMGVLGGERERESLSQTSQMKREEKDKGGGETKDHENIGLSTTNVIRFRYVTLPFKYKQNFG